MDHPYAIAPPGFVATAESRGQAVLVDRPDGEKNLNDPQRHLRVVGPRRNFLLRIEGGHQACRVEGGSLPPRAQRVADGEPNQRLAGKAF